MPARHTTTDGADVEVHKHFTITIRQSPTYALWEGRGGEVVSLIDIEQL